MLQTIRDHTHGWIASVIIGIIIITFALWGIHSYFTSGGDTGIVAEVNGVPISKNQLNVAYERLIRQAQAQFAPTQEFLIKNQAQLKERALQGLIEIQVLKQASLDQDFRISSQQVDSYLESMPEFQVNGQFSLQRFQDVLVATQLSTGDFLDLIDTSLLIEQPKLGTVLTSFALPSEVNNTIALVNQQREIQYLMIPQSHFLAQGSKVTDEQVLAYYNEHKNEFFTPEQVSVEYLQLSAHDLAADISISEAELKKFYDENSSSYTQPKQWKLAIVQIPLPAGSNAIDVGKANLDADKLMQQAKAGADVTKLANQYSANLNRQLQGWVPLTKVPADLQQSVGSLTKKGQLIGPIQTDKGIYIIKALDIQVPVPESFASAKNKILQTMKNQAAEEKFAEMREKLSDLTYEHPDSLQTASQNLHLPIQSSSVFTRNKGGADISSNEKIREAAFSNDVLNLHNNSELIQASPDTVVILRIKSHVPQNALSLQAVSAQIKNKLSTLHAQDQAEALAKSIKQKLQSGGDLNQLASANQLTWTRVGYVGRYGNKIDPALLQAAFQAPKPTNKPVFSTVKLANGYAVISLTGIKAGFISDTKQSSIFAEQVQNSDGLLEYELYKQSQIKSADIEITNPATNTAS